MSSRSTNTMQEGLQVLLKDIGEMKLAPDADLEFLIGLETLVLGKAREPIERMQQAGMTSAAPPPGMPGAGPMGPAPVPTGVGGGVPGLRSEPMTSPDEIRRMLAAGA